MKVTVTLHSNSAVRAITQLSQRQISSSDDDDDSLCPRSAHLDAADNCLTLHKLSTGDASVTAALVVM